MNESFQQLAHGQHPINLKTQQFPEQSIAYSRAYSKHSNYSNPEEMLNYFQQYQPRSETFDIQKLHQSAALKMKKYKESVYYGEFIEAKKHGLGIMVYHNNRLYEGEWQNDAKHGNGYQVFTNSSIYQGSYAHGKPEGVGRYSWITGEYYQGEWKGGLKHGSGMWRGAKGDSYIGQWKNGKADGYGVHTWVNGDRYEGEFKQCLKHGEGIQKFANGDLYKGSYHHGKPSGFGEYYWGNGSYFKGNFQNGLRDGKGVWKKGQGNSDRYEGEYKHDRKQGYGIFTWASGNVYKGTYQEDIRNGYGQMYWSDGSYYKGHWKNGIQNGQGEIFVMSEGKKRGRFENNVLVTVEDEQLIDRKPISKQKYQIKTYYHSHKVSKSINRRQSHRPTQNIWEKSLAKDLSKPNNNHPLIFNRLRRQTTKPLSTNKNNQNSIKKQRILHSSFFLHKMHAKSIKAVNQTSGGSSDHTKNQQSSKNKMTTMQEIKSFNKNKINTILKTNH